MAKKKVSHSNNEKPSQNQEGILKPNQRVTAAMDSEASNKIENLKSLNQILIKQAVEHRQQMESLMELKGSLESDLTQSYSVIEGLKSELTQLGERAAMLELERSVVALYVALQVGQKWEAVELKINGLDREVRELNILIEEKECEIGRLNGKLLEVEDAFGNEKEISRRVSVERDDLKDKLDLQIVESKSLRANLIELEGMKNEIEREFRKLQVVYDGVVEENKEKEQRIESVIMERDLVERELMGSNKMMEVIKEVHIKVLREKQQIEEEKCVEFVKRTELENVVSRLNEMVLGLQEEEEKLRVYMSELEKKNVEAEERQKDMGREIDQLVEEMKLSEERFMGLMVEKNVVDQDLVEALKQIDVQKLKIEEMVNEKTNMLEVKGGLDMEVGELKNQVAELNAAILKLEESGLVKEEKIKSLESEVGDYSSKLEQVRIEKNEIGSYLNKEKNNSLRLKEEIEELDKRIKESLETIEEAKTENVGTLVQKTELEGQCEILKKEITSLENGLFETRNEFDSMKGKFESAECFSKLVLEMLKKTSSFCSKYDEKVAGNGDLLEAIVNYEIEFEIIKNAFKSKESKVENMKREVELLEKSVKEADKKKSFWTVLSSVTTLLAAVSLAYVARAGGR